MIRLPGYPTSSQLLDGIAEIGKPVILNFSRGKDSIAVWLELADRGIEVIPIHKSIVPGLKFVREDLDRYEQHFQRRIIDLPADAFWRMLSNLVFQPPERCAIIEAADLWVPTREEWDNLMREAFAAPDTWILDGVRAADSATRMLAIKRWGPVKPRTRRQSPLWDWETKEVWARIRQAGIEVGPDYPLFKRSLDGIRYDYLGKIRTHFPDDYQTILAWFPLADLEIFRAEVMSNAAS
ncbi:MULTISPECIES: adenine nucleotide alpha hydrolase family protein [Nocardia]|uniref:phosphoadenosine phosphosulfate reductase n=1 Tax=Nocardia TaxID=1817 RepID=UPI00130030CE|nr:MULTISPECIES: phosphoadenosine phosphosulfate reductase [Nocardia]